MPVSSSVSFVCDVCVCACVRVPDGFFMFFPLFLDAMLGSQRSYPQPNLCFLPETFGCLELGPGMTSATIDLTLPAPRQMKIVRSPLEGTGQNGWKEMYHGCPSDPWRIVIGTTSL